jgi:hypothetical protein
MQFAANFTYYYSPVCEERDGVSSKECQRKLVKSNDGHYMKGKNNKVGH